MKSSISALRVVLAVAPLIVLPIGQLAIAQSQVYAYPIAGQSQQQQQYDVAECHQWAVAQTGFDPNRPPQQTQGAYATPQPSYSGAYAGGEMVRGAAGGAALGAIGGAIGGNAGRGAAIGAATGALFGGIRRASRRHEQEAWRQQQQLQAQQQQQFAQQQYQQGMQAYNRAYGTCMSARDYRVQ